MSIDKTIDSGTLVVVYWYDAVQDDKWSFISLIEVEKPPLAKSVGWFLNQDETCVRILDSVVDNEAGYSIIPKGMIKSIEVIQEDEIDVPKLE